MSSPIDICNRALRRLKQGDIVSFDGKTQVARDCELFYEVSRRRALRDHPWNFAQRRLRLAEMDAPDGYSQYQYVYLYPYDCLFLQAIKVNGMGEKCDYTIASNFNDSKMILTNCPSAVAVYTADVINPALFDILFEDALCWQIAAELAIPVTASEAKKKEMESSYISVLTRARVIDGREDQSEDEAEEPWLTARFSRQVVYR